MIKLNAKKLLLHAYKTSPKDIQKLAMSQEQKDEKSIGRRKRLVIWYLKNVVWQNQKYQKKTELNALQKKTVFSIPR